MKGLILMVRNSVFRFILAVCAFLVLGLLTAKPSVAGDWVVTYDIQYTTQGGDPSYGVGNNGAYVICEYSDVMGELFCYGNFTAHIKWVPAFEGDLPATGVMHYQKTSSANAINDAGYTDNGFADDGQGDQSDFSPSYHRPSYVSSSGTHDFTAVVGGDPAHGYITELTLPLQAHVYFSFGITSSVNYKVSVISVTY